MVAAIGLLAVILTAGCYGPASIYRDVAESRAQSYDNWLSERKEQTARQVLIKGNLSLEDALKIAIVNNKAIQAALEDKGVAKGRIIEAMGAGLPQANWSTTWRRIDVPPSFSIAGQPVILGPFNNYNTELDFSQPLFRGGSVVAGIKAAMLFSVLTDESIRGVTQDVIFQIARAYYDVLLFQQLVDVQRDGVAAATKALEVVVKKRAAGVAKPYDVLRAQVEVSNFQAQMIQQQNQVNIAMTNLLKLMGVSQESEVVLSDKFKYLEINPVFDEAVRMAYENRPELYQAELTVRLQKLAVYVAYSRYLPSVDAVFREQWSRPDPHQTMLDKWGHSWDGGINANWALFDGFQREGQIMQQVYTLRRNRIALIDAEETALQDVRGAVLSIQNATQFVQSQWLNYQRAVEGLNLAEVGFAGGVGTELEVYDAQAAATQAKAFYFQALHDHTVARLTLQRAMGILGPRPGKGPAKENLAVPGWIEQFMKPQHEGLKEAPPTEGAPEKAAGAEPARETGPAAPDSSPVAPPAKGGKTEPKITRGTEPASQPMSKPGLNEGTKP
jgi:outer membrane protein TolC